MDEENENAKLESIKDFHDYAEERIKFLQQLFSDGRQDEAMILCLSYIDSFSQWLEWPSPRNKSGQNFVNAVVKFGADSFMSLVHPLQAVKAFNEMASSWNQIAECIKNIYPGPQYELLQQDAFLSQLTSCLSNTQLSDVNRQLWRTTVAGVAYYGMRNFAIHKFGAPPLDFLNTTYQGHPASDLDFHRLYKVVSNLHSELRRRSETNGQLFGNDEIANS